MRYDINITLVMSVDVFDEDEAREVAEQMAGRIEAEAEWYAGERLTSPPPLIIVEDVTLVE